MEVAPLVSSRQLHLNAENADMIRGCVTPQVIHNWKERSEGDMELVDGYDELPDEFKVRVARAFEQGHVDDEDWNGVSDLWQAECSPC